jgi:hypothetical protein
VSAANGARSQLRAINYFAVSLFSVGSRARESFRSWTLSVRRFLALNSQLLLASRKA